MFNDLQATKNQKIDLIRMALNNYTSPYKVEGYDASTINNLTEFISDNIIYKKRKDYTENDLSSLMYKYSYRYFTQFVTPTATLDTIEMMIMYNKYMIFNIADDSMSNIFGVTSNYEYEVSLIDNVLNVNQDSSQTYSITIPYVSGEYRNDYSINFKLKDNQINTIGKIINISNTADGFIINTAFELVSGPVETPTVYNLTSGGAKVAEVSLAINEVEVGQEYTATYTTDTYSDNLINNISSDFSNMIDNMYLSEETRDTLDPAPDVELTSSEVLDIKKGVLKNTLEEIKSNGILKNVVIGLISEYSQHTTEQYLNPITGIDLNVSKMARDAAKHINTEINHTGIGADELHIIFKNSTNPYHSDDFSDAEILDFKLFMEELFR